MTEKNPDRTRDDDDDAIVESDSPRVPLSIDWNEGDLNATELTGADLVVRPALKGVGSADFAARKRSIEAGRLAMKAALAGQGGDLLAEAGRAAWRELVNN